MASSSFIPWRFTRCARHPAAVIRWCLAIPSRGMKKPRSLESGAGQGCPCRMGAYNNSTPRPHGRNSSNNRMRTSPGHLSPPSLSALRWRIGGLRATLRPARMGCQWGQADPAWCGGVPCGRPVPPPSPRPPFLLPRRSCSSRRSCGGRNLAPRSHRAPFLAIPAFPRHSRESGNPGATAKSRARRRHTQPLPPRTSGPAGEFRQRAPDEPQLIPTHQIADALENKS